MVCHKYTAIIYCPHRRVGFEAATFLDGPRFTGQLSVCGEITAQIALDGKPRFSFLCEGARRYADYGAEEVVLVLPYDLFLKLPDKMSQNTSMASKARAGLKHLLLKVK